jgi:serine/threonine protein kinase
MDNNTPMNNKGTCMIGGKTIGRYTLLKHIGEGINGLVFHGKKDGHDEGFAIKSIYRRLTCHPERGAQELMLLVLLKGQGVTCDLRDVIYIHDMDHHAPSECLVVLQLAEHSLTSWAQNVAQAERPLRFHAAMLQIASKLRKCHELGIIHCDVKPENIVVSKEGDFRLIDFGLSSRVEKRVVNKDYPVVTITYRDPDFGKEKEYTASLDVYSLGVVFAEMVMLMTKPRKEWPRLNQPRSLPPDASSKYDRLINKMIGPTCARINMVEVIRSLDRQIVANLMK